MNPDNENANIDRDIMYVHEMVAQSIGKHVQEVTDSVNRQVVRSLRKPMYTRPFTGHEYMVDLLSGHEARAKQAFRILPSDFVTLVNILESRSVLESTRNMSCQEQLGIFLKIVAHGDAVRECSELFQHSTEIISRVFNKVVDGLMELKNEFICMPHQIEDVDPILAKSKFHYPYFKNAIGAIDGTHIDAHVRMEVQEQYRNRKGGFSQNVMAAVGFNRMFHFVHPGWGGSAADMTVLRDAFAQGGFMVQSGKFYLVDSGYANTSKFIAPHKGHRYHIELFKNPASRHYKCPEELYNHRHASLRNVVERTFGILKLRFKLLAKMQPYPFAIQVKIVIACCVLHNIMIGVLGDAEINKYLEGEDITSSHYADMAVHGIDDELESISCPLIGDSHLGKEIRSQITAELWSSHTGSHLRL